MSLLYIFSRNYRKSMKNSEVGSEIDAARLGEAADPTVIAAHLYAQRQTSF